LSIGLIVFRSRESRSFGGAARLTLSVFFEIILSSLLAPIRMTFHSRFVVQNLLGRTVSWRSQGREDAETSWGEALRHHWIDTLVASAWGIGLYLMNPDYFWWVTPIVGALILSIPTSVLASRVSLGARARRWKLFLIPEEVEPPQELRDLAAHLAANEAAAQQRPAAERDGVVRVAADPLMNALHRVFLGAPRRLSAGLRAARVALLERVVAEGPRALEARERRQLLVDPQVAERLHEQVWALPERERAARWGRPGGA
jgi:membrane glycosyltransferase